MKIRLNKYHWINLGISLFVGIVIYLIIDPDPDPYQIQYDFVEMFGNGPNASVAFVDLNNDGFEEKVFTFNNQTNGFIICLGFTPQGGIIDQYNLMSEPRNPISPMFGDFDKDGLKEIYIICKHGTGLYIRQILPYEKSPDNLSEEIFLDSMLYSDGIPSTYCSNAVFADNNGDGFDEMYFSLIGQYKTHYPRKLYCIDWQNKQKVAESKSIGIIPESIFLVDLDKDGVFEITGPTSAAANIDNRELYPYHDHSAFLFSFDLDLELINDPIEFKDDYSRLGFLNPIVDYQTEITGLFHHTGRFNHQPFIFQTSDYSKLERKVFLPENELYLGMTIRNMRNGQDSVLVVVSSMAGLFFYNDSLIQQERVKFGSEIANLNKIIPGINVLEDMLVVVDLNSMDYLFYNPKGKLLCSHNFDDFSTSRRPIGFTSNFNRGSYYLMEMDEILFFSFHKNFWHQIRWLLMLVLFIGLYSFIYLIRWGQMRQIKIQERLKMRMRQLELVGLKNQLDPHFTFNALNVLNFLSSNDDLKGVENFTYHFSKLMRRQLEMSDQPTTTLYDELRFVEHYIELQKLRFDIPIKLDHESGSNVDMNLIIPKMMIHTHVENAIKHGLIPAGGGEIRIRIQQDKKSTVVTISDNGIGRKTIPDYPKSSESQLLSNEFSGRGLKVLDQLYDLYFQLYKIRIKQEFIDLKDNEGKPSGTEVRIWV